MFVLAGLVLGVQGARAFTSVGDDCVQGCADDAPDGTCPPNCNDCVCCAHQPPIAAETFTLGPPVIQPGQRLLGVSDELPANPDPREVKHVPKSLLD